VNGIVMGGLDWVYSMLTMWVSNAVCVGMLAWYGRDSGAATLSQIWWSLAAFMATQVAAGVARYESRTGVWSVLRGGGGEDGGGGAATAGAPPPQDE
jgi:hypothetical protein